MSTTKLESTGTCQVPSSFHSNLLFVPGRFELGIGRNFFMERCGQGPGQAAREAVALAALGMFRGCVGAVLRDTGQRWVCGG